MALQDAAATKRSKTSNLEFLEIEGKVGLADKSLELLKWFLGDRADATVVQFN